MTIEPQDVARHPPPLYRAIAAALAEAVEGGRLETGTRLPTVRALAVRLGVTVGTVARAYQLAEQRGLVQAEVGRGTFVRPAEPPRRLLVHADPPSALVDLAVNAPPPLAHEALTRVLDEVGRDPAAAALLTRYPPPGGLPRHREALATWLGERIPGASAGRVLLGNGVHSLFQATLAALCRPGDAVLIEALTYPGARDIVLGRDLRPVAVAIDREGIVPDAVERAVATTGARVLFLVPNLQNPTGALLPAERREALVAIARRRDLVLVEDDVYGRLVEPLPAPPLAALAPERTVHLASLSKCLAPGLRVAAALLPEALVGPVTGTLHDLLVAAGPLPAELFVRLRASGADREIARRLREEAALRHRLACTTLGVAPTSPPAFHVWLERLGGWRAAALASALSARGVRVADAATFCVDRRDGPDAIRLGLGGPERAALAGALDTVADLIRAGPVAAARVI